MAQCGWCKQTGLKGDNPPDKPDGHATPKGNPCKGFLTWSNNLESEHAHYFERAALGTLT
jgi:hypothetical protein